jgi:hypothetical protein
MGDGRLPVGSAVNCMRIRLCPVCERHLSRKRLRAAVRALVRRVRGAGESKRRQSSKPKFDLFRYVLTLYECALTPLHKGLETNTAYCTTCGQLNLTLSVSCPVPLVTRRSEPAPYGYEIIVDGSGCAVPCPVNDFVYGEGMSVAMDRFTIGMSCFNIVLGVLVLVGIGQQKKRLTVW